MQLRDYLNVIRQRWWVLLVAAFAAALAAYAFSKAQPTIFRAQATYLFDQSRNDFGLNMALAGTMNMYRELVLSRERLDAVSRDLQLDLTPEQLGGDVYVQALPDERKMLIQVDNTDPALAARIANRIGETLQSEVARINDSKEGFDRISAIRSEAAIAPQNRHSPNTRVNVLAGAILGGIVGLLLVFVLYFLDDTLKTSDDVDRFVGIPTIGAIPTSESSIGARGGGGRMITWLPRTSSK